MTIESSSASINALFKQEKWAKAKKLIEKELAKTPDSHWLLDRLSVVYYEQRHYTEALTFVERAYLIKPDCPLVLWDYAGTLAALDLTNEALGLYTQIINAYPDKLLHDECGEDPNWVSSLVMDCFFRVGVCMEKLNRPVDASWFFEYFIHMRKTHPKLESLYSVESAKKRYDAIAVTGDQVFLFEAKQARHYLAESVTPALSTRFLPFSSAGQPKTPIQPPSQFAKG